MGPSMPRFPSRLPAACVSLAVAAALSGSSLNTGESPVDLSRAVIVSPAGLSGPERKAVALLADEVERRTHLRWRQADAWPADDVPVIAVGPRAALRAFADHLGPDAGTTDAAPRAEGYQIL